VIAMAAFRASASVLMMAIRTIAFAHERAPTINPPDGRNQYRSVLTTDQVALLRVPRSGARFR
jgi:hypothetical protein